MITLSVYERRSLCLLFGTKQKTEYAIKIDGSEIPQDELSMRKSILAAANFTYDENEIGLDNIGEVEINLTQQQISYLYDNILEMESANTVPQETQTIIPKIKAAHAL